MRILRDSGIAGETTMVIVVKKIFEKINRIPGNGIRKQFYKNNSIKSNIDKSQRTSSSKHCRDREETVNPFAKRTFEKRKRIAINRKQKQFCKNQLY